MPQQPLCLRGVDSMRLLHLWIENYKNLKDFTIDFEKGDGLTMLIGTNGSGKSNILEAISEIFSGFVKPRYDPTFCFELEYSMNEYNGACVKIKIVKNSGSSTRYIKDGKQKTKKYLIDNKLIPSKVIALYSGEEDRLKQEYYQPFYKRYIREFLNNKPLSTQYMTFIDKSYWSIALLVLSTSENDESRRFISNQIGIKNIDRISINVDMIKYNNSSNDLVKSFVARLAPDDFGSASRTFDEYQQLFYDRLLDSDGSIVLDSNKSAVFVRSGIEDTERFERFSQALITKIIKGIEIAFDGGLSLKSLSEGEKKLILVKAVLEVVADQNVLILLDEPDSSIHESRKRELFDMLKYYTQFGRQIVLTSHSPTLADVVNENNVLMLKPKEDRSIESFDADRLERIKHLTGSRLSVFSDLPILLVEGKSDIIILQKVIKYFKESIEGYANKRLDFDMYSIGGTGNIKHWHDRFTKAFINRPILVCFDYDNGGHSGMSAFDLKQESMKTKLFIKIDNSYIFYIPRLEEIKNNFGIEDYFSKELLNEKIHEKLSCSQYVSFASIPAIKDDIKNYLGNEETILPPDELMRFKPLVDLLLKIVDDIYAEGI